MIPNVSQLRSQIKCILNDHNYVTICLIALREVYEWQDIYVLSPLTSSVLMGQVAFMTLITTVTAET